LLVASFGVLPVLNQFAEPMQTLDEALLLVYPEQMLAGRTPQQDFFTLYGPGGFGLLSALYSVTGPNVLAERAVGLVYHVAIATGVLHLTRPYGRTASRAAGVTSALLLVPLGLTAYAWLGGLALAIWSLALLVRPSGPRSAFVAGVLGGLVPAWRFEMVILLAASGPMIWKTKLWKPYVTGLAIALTPTALFLAASGPQVLENVIVWRIVVNAQLRPDSVPGLVWAVLAISVLTTVALLIASTRRSPRQRLTMSLAALCLLLLPQGIQRLDLSHVIFAACVIVPLGMAWLVALGRETRTNPVNFQRWAIVPTFLMLLILTASAASSLQHSRTAVVTHNGRSLLVAESERAELAALLQAISETVPEGRRMFVGASDMSVPTLSRMELYHLLPEYRADSYYLELPPGVAEKRGSPLLEDVRQADFLVLTDVPPQRTEFLFPYIGRGDDAVNRAVDSHFCPKLKVSGTTLLLRCDALGSGP
jgi:hypothetical protein